jgi:cyclic pyranopterin phosphate synthase
MPAKGIKYVPKKELLTYEEMERVLRVLASLGVSKLRITGGEPFVRQNLMSFLERADEIPGLDQLNITTNGVLTAPYVERLKRLGIGSINLSIDTLDRDRFRMITRRDEVHKVIETMHKILDANISLKINAVVIQGKNIEDIISLSNLTKEYPIGVRFIEEMPFNGEGAHYPVLKWTHKRIISHITDHFGSLSKVQDDVHSTSSNYRIPGHLGTIGVIAAFSRTFCGSCNRIRITSQGLLKTCLYDNGVLDIRKMLRSGSSDHELKQEFLRAFGKRAPNGFVAESNRSSKVTESMSEIGG